MKGWRTIIFGAAVAIVPALLEYVGGIDWTTFGLSPAAGSAIGAVIVILRARTDSRIGKKS